MDTALGGLTFEFSVVGVCKEASLTGAATGLGLGLGLGMVLGFDLRVGARVGACVFDLQLGMLGAAVVMRPCAVGKVLGAGVGSSEGTLGAVDPPSSSSCSSRRSSIDSSGSARLRCSSSASISEIEAEAEPTGRARIATMTTRNSATTRRHDSDGADMVINWGETYPHRASLCVDVECIV